ncbi:Peptidase S59, nucleoporin domain-containing protein [Rozella allomycis CSF55]|uniref:Peptidase S59, nucleoporin domain-containing protein n=1 Tax=Rozella allomycis (strain CSF55) TaxID=988480 RepID=A0A075AR65_ROZAC|nr:Peptidase S59, nucleoporin domain-containing protein [Rozella allomycis CSF55]|eukprot:EPZ32728.1 Peptidase S59, nucleoporin domain-containing protein [Rozella allomycis CSF55]
MFGSGFGANQQQNQQQQTPGFGQSNTGFGFGAQQPGQQPASGFGGQTGFGATNNNVFGARPAASGFGQPSTTTSGGFGFGNTSGNTSGGMFGQPASTGFGQPAAASSGGFGQPATGSTGFGFGSGAQTSGFGQTSTTGGFGQPSTSGSAFGQPSTSTTGGMFGSSTTGSTFGQPPATPGGTFGSSGLFGQQQQQTPSAFGQQQPATSGGMFGQPASSGFGTSTPATSGFGGQSGGMFGQGANTGFGGTSSGFGAQNTSGGFGSFGASGGFGSAGQSMIPTSVVGTGNPPFVQTEDTGDTTVGSQKNYFQNISMMPAYIKKSLEELRWEDYQQGKKFPKSSFGATSGFGGLSTTATNQPATTGTGLFGQTTTTAPAFGTNVTSNQQPSGGLFGQPSTTTNTMTSTFGSNQQQPTASLFGGNKFGTTTTTTQPTGGLFGNNTQPATIGGLFGQPASTTSAPAFGSTTTSTQPSGGLFQQNTSTLTQPSFSFGSTQPQQSQPAPQQQTTTTTGGFSFGQPSATTGRFGSTSTTGGLFGNTSANNTTTGTTSLFSNPSNTTSSFGGTAPSLFKPPTTTTNTGFSFGTTQPSTTTTATTNSLFPSSSTGQFSFGGNAGSSNLMTPNKPNLVATIDSQSYVQSPLFQNLSATPVVNRSPEKKNVTATPKFTPRSTTKFKPRSRLSLFESNQGGESSMLSPESFVTRKSLKELVIIPQSTPTVNRVSQLNPIALATPVKSQSKFEQEEVEEEKLYFMKPSLNQLRMKSKEELKRVENFVVGRRGYGSVEFLESVDLSETELDKIAGCLVVFVEKEIAVYPEEINKPPVGQGMNVPALVKLEKCWPVKRSTREPIKDKDSLVLKKHVEKLKKVEETEFVDYLVENGEWVFKVKHFSKYGVPEDEDDEEEEEKENLVNKNVNVEVKNFKCNFKIDEMSVTEEEDAVQDEMVEVVESVDESYEEVSDSEEDEENEFSRESEEVESEVSEAMSIISENESESTISESESVTSRNSQNSIDEEALRVSMNENNFQREFIPSNGIEDLEFQMTPITKINRSTFNKYYESFFNQDQVEIKPLMKKDLKIKNNEIFQIKRRKINLKDSLFKNNNELISFRQFRRSIFRLEIDNSFLDSLKYFISEISKDPKSIFSFKQFELKEFEIYSILFDGEMSVFERKQLLIKFIKSNPSTLKESNHSEESKESNQTSDSNQSNDSLHSKSSVYSNSLYSKSNPLYLILEALVALDLQLSLNPPVIFLLN